MDVDIDFFNKDRALEVFDHITASRLENNEIKPHNTGIYVTSIPVDPLTNLSTIDYREAEKRGYFKIDFLNVSVYKGVKNEDHLISLMNTEPTWELLEDTEFSDKLFHLNGHSDILKEMKPKSVEQLAAVLAMIRPAKRYLVGQPWSKVFEEIWIKPDNEYYFKHGHAISYAFAIVVQMNLIVEELFN